MSNAGRSAGARGSRKVSDWSEPLRRHALGAGRGQSSAHPAGDVGIDAFYNLTPALRANLSVNTDFAETEVDERRVNLTRFPLFFEEKRDFFLEGSSFFDFAREPDESVMPFFSRRIGRDDNGAPQRIDFGAKLTGQAGAFDVGVLQVRTGQADSLAGRTSRCFACGAAPSSSRTSAACIPGGRLGYRQRRPPHGRGRLRAADVDLSR